MDLTMSCSSLSLLFVISLHIHFPVPASGDFTPFQDCGPIFCGHQQISYPFRYIGQPSHCGYPGYELSCDRDNLTLTMESQEFRVIHINRSAQVLVVERKNLLQDICSERNIDIIFDSYLFNNSTIKLDLNLFNYTSSNLNFSIFHCESSPIPQSHLLYCSPFTHLYFALDAVLAYRDRQCFPVAFVPISREAQGLLPSPLAGVHYNAKISEVLKKGFEITWTANTSQCENCTKSGGRCGYDWRRQDSSCFCPDGAYSTNCTGRVRSRKHGYLGAKAIIGIAASGAGVGVTLILLLFFRKKPMIGKLTTLIKDRNEHFYGETKIEGLICSKRYTYKDIKRMTNFFEEKLGQGGYGCVYKGKLLDGQLVAVKLLRKLKGDAAEFFNEVASISRTSHVNVVSLRGFCFEGRKRALVYEFMVNGSLEKFIFNRNNISEIHQQLSWETLYEISLGIAHGLEYLHRGCNTRILHLDIKPHNILLDGNYCPKISDFGLAKICPKDLTSVSMLGARGTPGYIAPELIIRNIGGVSHKSDVYSYGMMVLEMVSRRKNIEVLVDRTSEIYFPHWVHQRLELQEELGLDWITNEEDEGIARKMIMIGLWCIQIDPLARPCMTQVVEMLKGSVETLQIPPKPSLSSPSRWFATRPCESALLQESNVSS